jgi:hypothetical protein
MKILSNLNIQQSTLDCSLHKNFSVRISSFESFWGLITPRARICLFSWRRKAIQILSFK